MVSLCSSKHFTVWACDTAIDWGATGDYLSGVGTILGALAVIYAAKKGASTFEQWRKQKLAERHMVQAERILEAVDNAKDALDHVRGPMLWAHEEEAAKKQLGALEDWNEVEDDRKKRLIRAQVYFNRLSRVNDSADALNKCRPMARAFFGDDIEKAISNLRHQFWVVNTYAEASIDHFERDDFQIKISQALSRANIKGDSEVSLAMEQSIATIEGELLPILRFGNDRLAKRSEATL